MPAKRTGEPAGSGGVTVRNVPVLDFGDTAFWERWRGVRDTRRFYAEALEHWQDRFATAAAAVAGAEPGGVLIHCAVGRDRTGLLAALLLSVVGVPADQIAADYALSADRLRPLYDLLIEEADDESERARLQQENESDAESMLAVLDRLDAAGYLLAGGADADDLVRIRGRLLSGDD